MGHQRVLAETVHVLDDERRGSALLPCVQDYGFILIW
jgi:hypothetical protein